MSALHRGISLCTDDGPEPVAAIACCGATDELGWLVGAICGGKTNGGLVPSTAPMAATGEPVTGGGSAGSVSGSRRSGCFDKVAASFKCTADRQFSALHVDNPSPLLPLLELTLLDPKPQRVALMQVRDVGIDDRLQLHQV